ncbi:aa3-type cytochrome c oxidase subunit IV [Roseivivax sp. CAU 1761]
MADHAEHKHGEMDITEQEKTFDGFVTFTIRTVVVIIVGVILLAMFNA